MILIHSTRINRSLDHPNIVGYRGSKTLHDDRIILAMEICDTSLGDLIEQREELLAGPLEAAKICKMAIDISSALDYLHTKAFLLHGDLKSYNVLIKNSFEHCKLCDFGVSLPLNSDGYVDLEKCPSARYIGTDIYSAPEIFNAPPQDISSKCDIFSFGLIIFECVSLRPPHYEHLEALDDSEMGYSDGETSLIRQQQPKKLFDDCTDAKENISIATVNGLVSRDSTLNESQNDDSVLIKSTAATIGDDTIQDITGTTFNDTINSEANRNHTIADCSLDGIVLHYRQPMRDVSASLNSTIDSDPTGNSFIDNSTHSINDTMEASSLASFYGTRPRIPDSHQFSEEYNICFETFYMCTHALPEERPTAGDLLKSLQNYQEFQ